MKKALLITVSCILICIILLGVIFCILAAPWLLIGSVIRNSQDPEAPKAKSGEFPFEIVYEINGERKTVEDVFCIEFDGVKYNEGIGKYNSWKWYLESSNKNQKEKNDSESILKDSVDPVLYEEVVEGIGEVEIYFELGSCEYYMGLKEKWDYYNISPGDIAIRSSEYTGPITDEELYEKYGIKIIKKSISEPVSEKG